MDKRTLRTRHILGKALAELLQDVPLHQISIRQITERAGVAYSTFFRNFETVEKLLESYVHDFLNEFQMLATDTNSENYRETTEQIMREIFEHVAQNPAMYHLVFSTPAIYPAFEVFNQTLGDQKLGVAQSVLVHILRDAPPLELLIQNNIATTVSLIQWWLSQENPPDTETMIVYYEQMAGFPMWRLLLGNDRAYQLLGIPHP